MKREIAAALLAAVCCLGLAACGDGASQDSSSPAESPASSQSASEPEAPSSVPLEEESPAGEPEAPAESSSEAPEAVPEGGSTPSTAGASGYREADLGSFSLWLPEEWVVDGNAIYGDASELPRHVADFSSEPIAQGEDPFAAYDQAYSDAESVSQETFGGCPAKSYFLQREVSEGGMTGFQNTIVFCIQADGEMKVITFYPLRGAGIAEQREKFEAILNSIQAR